jgi:hypothetical protein
MSILIQEKSHTDKVINSKKTFKFLLFNEIMIGANNK